jgi:hypothetical protein
MHDKKVLIVAQILISGMMAFCMTGVFGFFHAGLSREWIDTWMWSFVTAWPIAFVFSMVVSPVAFALSTRLTRLF